MTSDEHPAPSHVVAAHDRYQREVIEGLNLCPFARRSRESGRVRRRFFDVVHPEPDPLPFARALDEMVCEVPELEIGLLVFPVDETHPWRDPLRFEAWLRRLRTAHESMETPRFYLVAFHPELRAAPDRELTPDGLVPLIRRAPDPMVQCTRSELLHRVKAQAQAKEPDRIARELEALLGPLDENMRAVLAASIQTESRLSAEIAQRNFDAVAHGDGRAHFEALIAEIRALREGGAPEEP